MKKSVMLFLSLLVVTLLVAQPWQRNTFPGPGHLENGYPPGHGWDHVQAQQDLEVSSLDPNLRAYVDDEYSAVLAQDGQYFEPIKMPYAGSHGNRIMDIEFSRYNSSTMYVLLSHYYWKSLTQERTKGGIWRSNDLGKTWEHIYPLPTGTYEINWNHPNGTHIFEDPNSSRSNHLYFGTGSHGIVRSTDNGTTWEQVAPSLSNRCIKMVEAGVCGDATYIYAIAEKQMPVHQMGSNVPIAVGAPGDYNQRWSFDNNLNNSVAGGNSLVGSVSYTDCSAENTYAAVFNGTSNKLSIKNINYAGSGNQKVTVAAWVKTTNGSDQVIASFDEDEYWELGINGDAAGEGQIAWTVMASDGTKYKLASSVRVDDGDWHHVVASWNSGKVRIYIDGKEEGKTFSATPTFGLGKTRYGYFGVGSKSAGYGDGLTGPNNYFDGSLDDVRIFSNRGIATDSEAYSLYLERNTKNPVVQGSLWRIKVTGTGTIEEVTRLLPGVDDIVRVELNPQDPSTGWLLRKGFPTKGYPTGGREVYKFTNWGETITKNGAKLNKCKSFLDLLVNPSDPNHIFLHGSMSFESGFQYSLDGGENWLAQNRQVVDAHIPSLMPWNVRNHNLFGKGLLAGEGYMFRGKSSTFVPGTGEILWVSATHGLFRSTDKGKTFEAYGAGAPCKLLGQMAIAPGNSNYWATTAGEYGVVVSTDNGLSWIGQSEDNNVVLHNRTENASPAGNNWTGARSGSGVAFHPTDEKQILITYTMDGFLIKSNDAGKTWNYTGVSCSSGQHPGIFWNKSNPQRIYAGFKRSNDGGITWTDINKYVLAVSDANPDLIVGVNGMVTDVNASSLNLFVSVNGGTSWVNLPDPPKETVPNTSNKWHVVATARTYGKLPMDLFAIDPSPEHDPAVDPNNRVRILLAGRSGIYDYVADNANGGGSSSSWTTRNNGIEPNKHFSVYKPVPWMGFVTFDPRPGYSNVVYAAKNVCKSLQGSWSGEGNTNHHYPGGDNHEPFYYSIDGGITWKKIHGDDFPGELPSGLVMSLEVDSQGKLFAGTCDGIYHIAIEGLAGEYTSIDNYNNKSRSNHLLLFPNPAEVSFFLRNGINGQLDIYSIGGAKVKSQDYLVGDQVEVSMLEKGVYVLNLTSNDSYSLVFVKQ